MKLPKVAVASAALVAALGVTTTTAAAHADSAAAQADTGVGYTTSILPGGRSVATVLDAGAFRPVAGQAAVDVVDGSGAALTRIPLRYQVAGTAVPIDGTIGAGGRELTLVPQAPPVGIHPVYSQAAYQNMVAEFEKGWLGGGQLTANTGAVVGAVVGCVFFAFVGCIPGAAIGGTIGAANGVTQANPAFQPALFAFLATLP